jgi:hypothetical protein
MNVGKLTHQRGIVENFNDKAESEKRGNKKQRGGFV